MKGDLMRTRILLSTLVALCWAAPFARAQESADPAAWVPADAVFYFGVSDVEKLLKDYQSTSGYHLLEEAKGGSGPSILGIANKGFERFKERLAQMLEVPPAQLKNPFKGPAAFYGSVPEGKTMNKLEPGIVAAIGDR